MAGKWCHAGLLVACALGAAMPIFAQGTPQIQNVNTHGDKYGSGAFGASLFFAFDMESSFYRARRVQTSGSSAEFGEGAEVERSDNVAGLSLDWQFGSNSEMMGTNVGLKIATISANSRATNGSEVKIFDETVATLGFDFVLNFYKSEQVEADGRRRREGVGVAAFFGPSLNFMFGDLDDIRQLAALGFDAGVMLDIPLVGDDLQLVPSAWLDVNFHRNGAVDTEIFVKTDRSADPSNPNNDGIVVRSKTVLPPFIWNIGADLVYTPLFRGEDGSPINNWRFKAGVYYSQPFVFNGFQADKPSDPLNAENRGVTYVNVVLGISYVW